MTTRVNNARHLRNAVLGSMVLLLSSWLIAQELLSEEFLEYLGDYQQIDGQWVDPVNFAESLEQMAQAGRDTDKDEDRNPERATFKPATQESDHAY